MAKTAEEKRATDRAYHLAHRDEHNARNRAYYAAHHKEQRAAQQAWRDEHREEKHAMDRAYNAEHREELLAQKKASYAANPEPAKERAKAWKKANPEKNRALNRGYRRRHPETINAHTRRRRAKKADAAINDLSDAQVMEAKESYRFICQYCGKKFPADQLTVDHITPTAQSGDNTLHNITIACQPCNSRKRDGNPTIPVQPLLLTIAPPRRKRSKG